VIAIDYTELALIELQYSAADHSALQSATSDPLERADLSLRLRTILTAITALTLAGDVRPVAFDREATDRLVLFPSERPGMAAEGQMNGSGTYAGGGYVDLSGERHPPAERAVERCGCGACREVMRASSCAVHNEPAGRNGPCDCGATMTPRPASVRACA
jgi:hypothetical protein